jgi:hypothetical protein
MDTDTDPGTEPDNPPDRERAIGVGVLLTCTVLVAIAMFALSFYGLEDYGRTGMGLPGELSWMVPIGIDLFSLCGISATYLLRNARLKVRAYAWTVFLVPTLLSMLGNFAHAEHRALGIAGIGGAAAVPLVLALAAHLVVVTRRNAARADTDPDMPAESNVQVIDHRSNGGADTEKHMAMARALAVRSAGGTLAEQAHAAGVDERTVRRWFGQPQRRPAARSQSRPAARAAQSSTQPDAGATPAGPSKEST